MFGYFEISFVIDDTTLVILNSFQKCKWLGKAQFTRTQSHRNSAKILVKCLQNTLMKKGLKTQKLNPSKSFNLR